MFKNNVILNQLFTKTTIIKKVLIMTFTITLILVLTSACTSLPPEDDGMTRSEGIGKDITGSGETDNLEDAISPVSSINNSYLFNNESNISKKNSSSADNVSGSPGIGFLVTNSNEQSIPLLKYDNDFLEMVLGPGKVRYFDSVSSSVKVMCISMSLSSIAESVSILKEANIQPERVYIAYNPEQRAPQQQAVTPDEELDDLVGSIKKAGELLQDYDAMLISGPGLSQMQGQEQLYPEAAKYCDGWMIQTQRLQFNENTGMPVTSAEYRTQVKKIVDMLKKGNPEIKVFVQIIPGQWTARENVNFTAELTVEFLKSVEDIVDSVAIYGGDTELIADIITLLRKDAGTTGNISSSGSERQDNVNEYDTAKDSAVNNYSANNYIGGSNAELMTSVNLVSKDIMVNMRDGARLATDIYMPDNYSELKYPDGVPVILVRTIYDKGSGNEALLRWQECFINNGYAFVVQDVRGFYGSRAGGTTATKQYDGYDTIEWLAVQQWCSGKVGMLGFSALGAAQYEAAVTAPPHLKCAIPAQAPGNYYTNSYYPAKFRKADYETILRGTFTSNIMQMIESRFRNLNYSRIEQFNIPMIHTSGWYDFYKEGAIEIFNVLQDYGSVAVQGKQQLIIGPWGHGVAQEVDLGMPLEMPGGLAYPSNARLEWEKEIWLPWFDFWLKGIDTGIMGRPSVKYYLMGDVDDPDAPGNEWVEADIFPPKSNEVQYYIHENHTLNTVWPIEEKAQISYRFDPLDPVPTVGRFDVRIPVKGPYDQRETEGRDDVLVFTTPKLGTPLKIIGQVKARLWASSDRKDTDFTVKLTDVYPDGKSVIFSDGIVKGRYRNTFEKEELLVPGQVYEFDIDLGYIAIVLAPGHQLRIAISSSNFDRFDINPNTGEPFGVHAVTLSLLAARFGTDIGQMSPEYTKTLAATNTIYMDKTRPSHIILPVVP